MKIQPIETSRLILRGFTKEDALWAYRIWNDPEMGFYLPDEVKEEIDLEYLKELEVLGEDEECCYLIPIFKDSEERVGTCSFIFTEEDKIFDIAYCVHKDFQCQGYATEIAQGLIRYARAIGAARAKCCITLVKRLIRYARAIGAEKVTLRVSKENIPSNRVAIKCGGKPVQEGTYRKKGTETLREEYLYEILL